MLFDKVRFYLQNSPAASGPTQTPVQFLADILLVKKRPQHEVDQSFLSPVEVKNV
jgi:hypothetical protein